MKERFLIFENDSPSYHCRLIYEGVRRYFREGNHEITFLPIGVADLDCFDQFPLKAIFSAVCWLEKSNNIEYLQQLGIPILNLCETQNLSPEGPQLRFSGEGRIAAEFFIDEMNFESLIFIGKTGISSHQRRASEFKEAAEKRNRNVHLHFLQSKFADGGANGSLAINENNVDQQNAILRHLLLNTPRPVGFFCADDRIALNLYFRAQHLGIPVPEEISILGVGSLQGADEGRVESISVVQMDHIRQGQCAAHLMEQFLTGKACRNITLAPDGIVHRGTTFRRMIHDPLIRQAFELIDQDRSMTVNELSIKLAVTRRTLRKRFLIATNMNPAKAIDLERFQYAKQLIKRRRFSHEAIASLAGYRNHKQMLRSFDRFVHMSPSQYCRFYLNKES